MTPSPSPLADSLPGGGATGLTRRRLLVTLLAVLLVAAGAWTFVSPLDDGSDPETREPLDGVPNGASYVGHLDADSYREDDDAAFATRRALRFQSAVQFYDGPPFLESYAVRDAAPADAPNASAVSEVTYFGRNDSAYRARIVVAEWTRADLGAALEADANVTLSRTTVNGTTLLRGGGLAVATLGNVSEGRVLAVGNETAVRDAVAVTQGTEPAVDGALRRQFEATDDGYVRYAFRFRPSTVPDYPFVGEAVRSVRYVRSSYTLNYSAAGTAGTPTSEERARNVTPEVRVDLSITAADEDSARSVRSILNAGTTFYRIESRNATLRGELGKVELPPADGQTVRLTYQSTPTGVRVLIRGLYRNQPDPSGRLTPPRGAPAGERP